MPPHPLVHAILSRHLSATYRPDDPRFYPRKYPPIRARARTVPAQVIVMPFSTTFTSRITDVASGSATYHGATNRFEMKDYLGVTMRTLKYAVEKAWGVRAVRNGHKTIRLYPSKTQYLRNKLSDITFRVGNKRIFIKGILPADADLHILKVGTYLAERSTIRVPSTRSACEKIGDQFAISLATRKVYSVQYSCQLVPKIGGFNANTEESFNEDYAGFKRPFFCLSVPNDTREYYISASRLMCTYAHGAPADPSYECDHLTPLWKGGAVLDPANLQWLAPIPHQAKTNVEQAQFAAFKASGMAIAAWLAANPHFA